MSLDINSKDFWTGVGGIIGYTMGERIWPDYNGNGEEVSKVFVYCMRGGASIVAASGLRNHFINSPVSFNDVALGISVIAFTCFSTQYLYPSPDIFVLGK